MIQELVADVLVNILGAIGLVMVIASFQRVDPAGTLARRVTVALSLSAALFVVRAAAWLTGSYEIEVARRIGETLYAETSR